MLLELATKEFTEPQLISYSPVRPLSRGTFPPLPSQTSQVYTVQPTTTFTQRFIVYFHPHYLNQAPRSPLQSHEPILQQLNKMRPLVLGGPSWKASRHRPGSWDGTEEGWVGGQGPYPHAFFFSRGKNLQWLVALAGLIPTPLKLFWAWSRLLFWLDSRPTSFPTPAVLRVAVSSGEFVLPDFRELFLNYKFLESAPVSYNRGVQGKFSFFSTLWWHSNSPLVTKCV